MKRTTNTRYLVELALFIAIVLVMKLTGLSSIPVGPLNMTFTMVPIAIGAMRTDSTSRLIRSTTNDFRSLCSRVRFKAMEMGQDRMVVYFPEERMFYIARPIANQEEAMEYEDEGFVTLKESFKWALPKEFELTTDENRQFLTWLHLLWEEGLLDQNGFSTADSLRQITDDDKAIPYGVLLSSSPLTILPESVSIRSALNDESRAALDEMADALCRDYAARDSVILVGPSS